MDESDMHAVFEKMRDTHDDNKVCFECQEASPQWASVNNAILVCLTCCGLHRGLGTQTSLVRSTTLDMWTEKQLKLLSAGGNHALNEFMETYNLRPVEIKLRYTTKALAFYRRQNEAKALGKEFTEEAPSVQEGRTLPDGRELTEDGQLPPEPQSVEHEDSEEPLGSAMNVPADDDAASQQDVMKKLQMGMGNFFKTVQDHSKQLSETENVKQTQAKIIEGYQKTAVAAKEGTTKAVDFTKQKWDPVQKKLDETGVTAAAVKTGESIKYGAAVGWGMTKVGAAKLNEKIDANPKLADAKNKTYAGMMTANSYVTGKLGGYFGWGKKAEPTEEPVEMPDVIMTPQPESESPAEEQKQEEEPEALLESQPQEESKEPVVEAEAVPDETPMAESEEKAAE